MTVLSVVFMAIVKALSMKFGSFSSDLIVRVGPERDRQRLP